VLRKHTGKKLTLAPANVGIVCLMLAMPVEVIVLKVSI